MRIFEIATPLRTINATVRVDAGYGRIIVRTQVKAEGIAQARALLQHSFGAGNVLNIT